MEIYPEFPKDKPELASPWFHQNPQYIMPILFNLIF